jgi:hypothetical protein
MGRPAYGARITCDELVSSTLALAVIAASIAG